MKPSVRTLLGCVVLLPMLAGCATGPQRLSEEEIGSIKKLAVISTCPDEEIKVLDHTGVWKKSYTGYQFGAIGGLIDGIVLGIEAKIKINKSLGGDPDLLRREMKGYPIKAVFDESFSQAFKGKFEIVSASDCDLLLRRLKSEGENTERAAIEDYSVLHRQLGADTVLVVDFVYGLAAYTGAKANAVVSANVSLINAVDNRRIMKRRIDSDIWRTEGHTIDEYRADGARVYKDELVNAIKVIATQVESFFVVPASLLPKEKDGSGLESVPQGTER